MTDQRTARYPAMRVTRFVAKNEPHNFLRRDVNEGEVLFRFDGTTYGCISWGGIAVSEVRGENPFYEFPADAIEEATDS